MRIGVDARKLRDGGIGTYIRNLLTVFFGRKDGHRFVVFLLKQDLGALAHPGSPAEEVRVRAGKYSVSEHWLLARAARRSISITPPTTPSPCRSIAPRSSRFTI